MLRCVSFLFLILTISVGFAQAQFATGKWTALWGFDFGFADKGDHAITARDAMIAEAKRQFAEGLLVPLTWLAVRPTDDEPAGLKESVQGKFTNGGGT